LTPMDELLAKIPSQRVEPKVYSIHSRKMKWQVHFLWDCNRIIWMWQAYRHSIYQCSSYFSLSSSFSASYEKVTSDWWYCVLRNQTQQNCLSLCLLRLSNLRLQALPLRENLPRQKLWLPGHSLLILRKPTNTFPLCFSSYLKNYYFRLIVQNLDLQMQDHNMIAFLLLYHLYQAKVVKSVIFCSCNGLPC
jgi:hypothetical protein